MKHCKVRETLKWGTFGKNPISYDYYRVQWVYIKDLSDSHIDAILHTQWQIEDTFRATLHEEIIYRTMKNIQIKDVDRYYK